MTIFGIGIHILIAVFFAVHVVRNGQQLYWLLILFMFPPLGSVVYFFAIYLPNSRLPQGARKVASVAVEVLDPNRELREAKAAFEYTPTAQNQMRLASAQLEAGNAKEAASTYEACLQGAFASDLEIRLGAARAYLECERGAEALTHLEFIRRSDIHFRPEMVSLLTARALAQSGRQQEAKAEFDDALTRYNSFECRAECAIWAARATVLAERLLLDIDSAMARWSSHTVPVAPCWRAWSGGQCAYLCQPVGLTHSRQHRIIPFIILYPFSIDRSARVVHGVAMRGGLRRA